MRPRQSQLDEAIENLADQLVSFACDNSPELAKIAQKRADLSDRGLIYMGEHDEDHPRYRAYYSQYSCFLQKALGRAIDKMVG